MSIDIPYLDYDALQCASEKFLADHNPDGIISLPIEELVELELGISVVLVRPGFSIHFNFMTIFRMT